MSFFFRLVGAFCRIDEKLVLLSSMSGDQYGGSPEKIFAAMQQDPRFDGLHYVWAFTEPRKYSDKNLDMVQIDSLQYFLCALRAKVWITDVNIERGLNFKKKETIYLNTWHGTGPKKSGNAVKERKDYDFSHVDILCCDGYYLKNIFIKYFNANEKNIIWSGRPREDELFSFGDRDRKRFREKLGIGPNKIAILYMPTWREYGNLELNYTNWEKTLGDKYVFLVREHHFALNKLSFRNQKQWRDVTEYADVNELYCAADILISDYSSAFWDYAILGKPMFCYAYDYDRYCASTGLLFDMQKGFPNGIKRTEEEVIQAIQNMNYEKECEKTKMFCKKFISRPADATSICLNRIYELYSGVGKK